MAARCRCFQTREDLTEFLELQGLSPERARTAASQIFPWFVFLEKVPEDLACALLEDIQRGGGRGLVLPGERGLEGGSASVFLAGSPESLMSLAKGCVWVEPGDASLPRAASGFASLLQSLTQSTPAPIVCRGKRMDFSVRPLLMGVLNVTPDSFSDGGRFVRCEKAVERAFQMIEEGADILDLGGASSRPGSDPVADEVQKQRVLPVIREIRKTWDGWISVDTCSSDVARAAIDTGADILNDISAGRMDAAMKEVAAEKGVPVVLMHMKGTPKTMQSDPTYASLFRELLDYFEERIRVWTEAGVSRDRILIDPGIGFGKTSLDNLQILKHLEEFKVFGRPVVLGTSRKSFIGAVLHKDVQERLIGTLATVAIAAWNGAHVVRVHDVAETREVLAMVHAIRQSESSSAGDGGGNRSQVDRGQRRAPSRTSGGNH